MPITPYTGTWGQDQRLHLLRRTLFGVNKADIAAFATSSMSDMVTSLLTFPTTPTTTPMVDYVRTSQTTDPLDAPNTTWVNSPSDGNYNFQRTQSLRGWWMGLMLQQDRNIREKMTFFWHNHVPTDIGSSFSEAHFSYQYNVLLRQSCLGNFKTLMRQISTHPAMLYYLNGRLNTKTGANENYARELQELFCIGKDISPSYSQADVVAAAQVLTGWEIDTPNLSSKFTATRHTTGNKTFSGFYGNGNPVVITGSTSTTDAATGPAELDAMLNMIFAHPEVARYVVRKIYRFFVYYKIDATVEANVIVPLADLFRTGGYAIKPVMESLFTSQHFFDMATANSCLIKNPLDHNIGLARTFGVVLPVATDFVNLYKDFRYFSDESDKQQLKPGNPPNVSGWPAYYQTPNFHELWITADTLRKKKEFCDKLLASNFNNMKVDVLVFTMTLNNPADPNLLIDEALFLLHPLPSDTALKTSLKAILLSNQTEDKYWTTAWTNYVGAPTNTTYANTARTRLQTLYQAITNMAEFHLS